MSKPFALESGQGWAYEYGIRHVVKCGERGTGNGAAIFELTTRKGEEPPTHSHGTEDEAFYVLEGEIAFHCDGQTFELSKGGFVFLPKGSRHGYTFPNDGEVRLLAITFPTREVDDGWGGYVSDVESQGEFLDGPDLG
jgi:quercetin dioxygenase-like cupin family protein